MIRILRLLKALRGPWIADDPNPETSQLDHWDGITFDPDNQQHCQWLLEDMREDAERSDQ
jgi:hypothetical protein